ncbi:hypothetical protein RFI_32218, partial [Reticulomyxa filosa]
HFPATRPFQMVALDIVSPLPEAENGYQYIFTMIDRFTRYVAAVPLKTSTAKEVTLAFTNEWIYRHGIPETILSDNGAQFTGKVAECMSEIMGIKQAFTSSYHPQTNGMLERFHRYLKKRLGLDITDNCEWTLFLPAIVTSYNIAPNKMTMVSPHELIYGEKFKLITDNTLKVFNGKKDSDYESLHEYKGTLQKQLKILRDGALKTQSVYDTKRKRFENKLKHKDNFEIGDSALLFVGDQRVGNKAKLLPKFVGPYTVIQRMSPVTLRIQSEKGFQKTVHASKIRKLNMEDKNPKRVSEEHVEEGPPPLEPVDLQST